MPTEDEVTRKLRAILSADVKGYSLLMADDETFTVKTLKSYRKVMSAQIVRAKGRVVDTPGDNLLAEFSSAVDAVQCAVEIQKILKEKNEDLPQDKRLEFRIGVNIGDVIQDGDGLYGEGVNIAARIEGLADAGGVCISRNAYDHISNKLNYGYEYLGEHSVKNIIKPVRVYKVLMDPEDAGKLIGDLPKRAVKNWVWSAVVVGAIVFTSVAWQVYQTILSKPEYKPASVERMAYPLPDKPSIVVLPFDNMSGDSDQDYIAESISENITAALSSVGDLFVIARNSAFTYKGKPVKVQQVSEELGVRYVLEGSITKSDGKLRVTAQLIDAITGGHIWSDRYDRNFEELLTLIDDITWAIVVELQVKLTRGEMARTISTDNMEAWILLEKANRQFALEKGIEGLHKGRAFIEKALELDPDFSGAITTLAWSHFWEARYGLSDSRTESFKKAIELAKKSLAINDKHPSTHELFLFLHLYQKQYDKAIEAGRKAVALGPNRANGYISFCEALYRSGHFKEAVPMCERAIRLQPRASIKYFGHLMNAYYWVGRYEDSLAMADKLIKIGNKFKAPGLAAWGYWGSICCGQVKSDTFC